MSGIETKQGGQPVPDDALLDQAAGLLARGGLVAFPTETWYGLAADPRNPRALARLYAVKQRPADKPVLVLVNDLVELERLVSSVPPPYLPLMEHFWPGPLTLVFPARSGLPSRLTAGTGTIAIRSSPHPLARALVERFGGPVTATSANLSGQPACGSAAQVRTALGRAPDLLVMEGGTTPGGTGSTIVAYRDGGLVCLRGGQLDFAAVLAVHKQQPLLCTTRVVTG